jgi:hypothetical protein
VLYAVYGEVIVFEPARVGDGEHGASTPTGAVNSFFAGHSKVDLAGRPRLIPASWR